MSGRDVRAVLATLAIALVVVGLLAGMGVLQQLTVHGTFAPSTTPALSTEDGPINSEVAAATSPDPIPTWSEPPSYTYVVEPRCGFHALPGRWQLTVVDNVLSTVDGLDGDALPIDQQFFTLQELLRRAERAVAADAYQVTVETDPADGHPTSIRIDRRADQNEDLECYIIDSFEVAR